MDSDSYPSFIKKRTGSGKRRKNTLTVENSNGNTNDNMQYHILLTMNERVTIPMKKHHKKLKTNLLSVRGVVNDTGPIIFAEGSTYIIPLQMIKVLNLKHKKTHYRTVCTFSEAK